MNVLKIRWKIVKDFSVKSDLLYQFLHNRTALAAGMVAAVCLVSAIFAPWIAPQDPYDLANLELINAHTPPVWIEGGQKNFILGTDDQGRDLFSAIIFGARISLIVGLCSVILAMLLGVSLGLISGFIGGMTDTIVMRICDVMLSFPAILVALLIDGIGRAILPQSHEELAFAVLIISITMTGWVQYARTVRASTMVERQKEYVMAAQVMGVKPLAILLRHILPNVLGPVMVIATIQVALAIQTEAALSYLGVGVPPTHPSLGTLIRTGQEYLFSGEWWISIFPGVMLAAIALSINLLGDWLRDALNPRLSQ